MLNEKCLDKIFLRSKEVPFDEYSKIVIMSDCHRGDGTASDNFSKNQFLYNSALKQYYKEDFTYIELGDGDELWENRSFQRIVENHKETFQLLSKFYRKNRLYFLYGNHDQVKSSLKWQKENLTEYKDTLNCYITSLFPDINIYESLKLVYKNTKKSLFLIHGHQLDFLNYNLWFISRFLVRYLWRPLELIGVQDPTSTYKNELKSVKTEDKYVNWTKENNQILIAGHTHRPIFPHVGEHLYFNDGSCVNPGYITAIEIEKAKISLVKWKVNPREDGSLYARGPISRDGQVMYVILQN